MLKVLAAFAAAAIFAGGGSVLAEDGTMTMELGALAVGNITTLTEGRVFWTGHFSGSAVNIGDEGPIRRAFVTCPGTNELNFVDNTSKLSGFCVLSDGAESRLLVEWTCTGTPGACVDGTGTWSNGTGKWEGYRADVTWTTQLGAALEDGSTPAYATWTINYSTP